jgi:hypothetical protein
MKVKGSKQFIAEDRKKIVKNLKKIVKNKGKCAGIPCGECIFSRRYAEDGESCGENSILKLDSSRVGYPANIKFAETAKNILLELGEPKIKIKGSVVIRRKDVEMHIKNLTKVYKEDCFDTGVKCRDCIFSEYYAEDEKMCSKNSVWNKETAKQDERIESLLVELINLKQNIGG